MLACRSAMTATFPLIRPALAFALALAAGSAVRAAASSPLVAAAEKAAATLPAGGIVVAEISADGAAFAGAGNYAPRAGLAPERVVFEIGSITKVFTGLLLAHAVLEGKASLDDPIAKHLPADLALHPDTAAITLLQLATHTSGLPRLPANLDPAERADPYADYSRDRFYAFLRGYRPAAPAPQPAAYSNLGFGLLGHLLERIWGRGYGELVAEKIAGPLGLADTQIGLDPERAARFAVPHSGSTAVAPWQLPVLAGAGALRSTAADMARFAQALLAGRPAAFAAAWELARTPRADFGDRGGRIGLGILIGTRDGDTVYNHAGGTGGFRTHLAVIPARQKATVILINNDTLEPGALLAAAQARSPAAATPAAARPAREETPLAADRLTAYPGIYDIDGRGRFTFVLDDTGRLRGRLTGQAFLPVFHAGNDRFFARAVAAEFQFARDAAGDIVSVTLHQNGREVPARRTAAAPPAVRFPPADKLRAYTGRFQLAPGALFEIEVRNGTLFVKLTGQPALPVFCTADDRFVYEVVDAALTFERDAGGAVVAVTLHQNGRDQRAPRVPVAATP